MPQCIHTYNNTTMYVTNLYIFRKAATASKYEKHWNSLHCYECATSCCCKNSTLAAPHWIGSSWSSIEKRLYTHMNAKPELNCCKLPYYISYIAHPYLRWPCLEPLLLPGKALLGEIPSGYRRESVVVLVHSLGQRFARSLALLQQDVF